MNLTIIIIVIILALVLIVFTTIRNLKDEKNFEEYLNNDYPKSIDKKGDFEDDGL